MFNDSIVESYPLLYFGTFDLSLLLANVFLMGLKDKECLVLRVSLIFPVNSSSSQPIDVILMTLIGVAGRKSRPIQLARPLFLGRSLDCLIATKSGNLLRFE